MLYYLSLLTHMDQFEFFRLFRYLTFRAGGAVITAILFAFIVNGSLIQWLKIKQGKGQPIRADGPQRHIVEKAGLKANHVHVHLGKLAGDQQRMDHVRFAGEAFLLPVPFGSEAVGAVERRQIFVGTQAVNQTLEIQIHLLYRTGGLHDSVRHGLLPV